MAPKAKAMTKGKFSPHGPQKTASTTSANHSVTSPYPKQTKGRPGKAQSPISTAQNMKPDSSESTHSNGKVGGEESKSTVYSLPFLYWIGSHWHHIILAAICLVMAIFLLPSYSTSKQSFYNSCFTAHVSSSPAFDRVMKSFLLGANDGILGVHIQVPEPTVFDHHLEYFKSCGGAVYTPSTQLKTIKELDDYLRTPWGKSMKEGRPVMYVIHLTEGSEVATISNAFKEVLETNRLQQRSIVPSTSKAMVVLLSDMSRAEMKEVVPHRVMHLLTSIVMNKAE